MSGLGPFQTEREAREWVRLVISPAIYEESIHQGNRTLLRTAVTSAGIELGDYDRQIFDWLADFELATVAVIAAVIFRASDILSPGYSLILGQALADALAYRQALEDGEQAGLYQATAQNLRVPGDITLGPGAWHPDAGPVPTSEATP